MTMYDTQLCNSKNSFQCVEVKSFWTGIMLWYLCFYLKKNHVESYKFLDIKGCNAEIWPFEKLSHCMVMLSLSFHYKLSR